MALKPFWCAGGQFRWGLTPNVSLCHIPHLVVLSSLAGENHTEPY